jgi:hypothetical protein
MQFPNRTPLPQPPFAKGGQGGFHGNCHALGAPMNDENQPLRSPFRKGGQGDFLCKSFIQTTETPRAQRKTGS